MVCVTIRQLIKESYYYAKHLFIEIIRFHDEHKFSLKKKLFVSLELLASLIPHNRSCVRSTLSFFEVVFASWRRIFNTYLYI